MGRGVGSIWCFVLLIPGLLPGLYSEVNVVIDNYTHNSTLTPGELVHLGRPLILVCRVVGLPYGTPLSYTWTCPNGPCEVKGYYGRKVYNEHILAVNTTSTSDGGTYTCQVTATGGQEATGNFTLSVTDGRVVHSYGRLIPHEFPITDLQQISGPDGIGRITCTVTSGRARFAAIGGVLETGGVSQTKSGATATLIVNPSNVNSFQNRGLYCTDVASNVFFLFISSANPLRVPSLTLDRVTNAAVDYRAQRNDAITDAVITGYEVIRFGVPMIGEYVNAGTGPRVTISPVVPGAQYRITAWALHGDFNGARSTTPALAQVTTGKASVLVSSVQVVIDGYTRMATLACGDSVPLGRPLILVCRVVGLPYGTPLSYTWTCPNGPCEVEGYYGRKVYNKHILAINTTSTSDGGTYTCHVTATGGQEATGNFTFSVPVGLAVVHSYGRLIPCDFPITNLQQISGPDGIGRITCALNSGSTTIRHEATATLVLSLPDSLNNRDMYCLSTTNYFFFFPSPNSPLNVPRLTVNASRGIVKYRVERRDTATTRVITGYDMFRFGVQMIGRYANLGTGRSFTTGPAVPGAQYRITAWALGNGRRSTKPVVEGVTMGESTPSPPKLLSITRIMKAEIELNWLSPTEPNGEVHYVIYYTPEGGTEQSIDTGSDLTHYNLTGLERNRVYTDIAVRAVNAAGTSVSSTVILQYNHMPDGVPTAPQTVTTTRVFQDGVELNWLPPTEPNGEVHYVIYYTPEGGTERSVDTGSNLRHYNLTGLERNRVYTNISVQAVNIIGRSGRSTVIAQYNHTLPDAEVPIVDSSASSSGPLLPAVVSLGVVVLLLITCVALLALALAVTATKLNKLRAEKAHTDPLYYYNQTGGGEETKDRIYDEVGEGTEERRHYHELNQETMEKRQYKTLHGEDYRC